VTADLDVPARECRRWPITGRSRHDVVVSETEIDHDDAPAAKTPLRARLDKTMVFMLVLLGVGAVLVVRGLLVGITGEERSDLPVYVESVDPVPEAVQVPNQSGVFVDLVSGYTGVLIIDDIEIETRNIDDLGRVDVEPGEQIE
jgi:hypothetical protein